MTQIQPNQEILEANLNDLEVVGQILTEINFRKAICCQSHLYFLHTYLAKYIKCPTADFQKEVIALTEDTVIKHKVILAFRNCGKSTIVSTSLPLWATIGKLKKKDILIISQTQKQSRYILRNIKNELETNNLLINDFGYFESSEDEWNAGSIVLPKYGTRITAISRDQGIRGTRHGIDRPDLIILDDFEDIDSTRSKDSRDNTFTWLTQSIIPLGDSQTNYFYVGNLVHRDCVIMRLIRSIQEGKLNGVYRKYPLIEEGKILWPGKYPSMIDVEDFKKTLPSEVAFRREYLLEDIAEENSPIQKEWVKYYDSLPNIKSEIYHFAIGVDPALSENDAGCNSGIVSAKVELTNKGTNIYILPGPINQQLKPPQLISTISDLSLKLGGINCVVFMEEVAMQGAFTFFLKERKIPAEGIKVGGRDKRMRLASTAPLIQAGRILFPKKGAEDLIDQITNFPNEKGKDLADAFSTLIEGILKKYPYKPAMPGIFFIGGIDDYPRRRGLSDW